MEEEAGHKDVLQLVESSETYRLLRFHDYGLIIESVSITA